jgi:predicted Zn-dependent protease
MKNSRKLSLPSVGNSSISNLVFETKAEASNPLQNATFLFTNLMAFHTVDTMTGKFALEGEGFEIIDGKKTGFVKNVALSSSVRELFNNIE